MILMVLPAHGFDPTESAVPWWYVKQAGHGVAFATPEGKPSFADPRLVEKGFGWLSPLLMTRRDDIEKYRAMEADPAFQHPLAYSQVHAADYRAVIIPGGHEKGVKTLLESSRMQQAMVEFFERDAPVAAVCHGVLLLARSRSPVTGRSVLHGRKTAALTNVLELAGWWMTRWWLGDYYRTYPVTVQDEVTAALAQPSDFKCGPLFATRDSESSPQKGFVVRDGNYLSARWPGDCHRFGETFVKMLRE